MNLVSGVRQFVFQRGRFHVNSLKQIQAGVTLRLLDKGDKSACMNIYAKNEVGRFPAGFTDEFEFFLDRSDYLKLVLCMNNIPVAVGGIGWTQVARVEQVLLVFGMVTPDFHRQGLGAALLLARLALLPKPWISTRIFMTNMPDSAAYYARYGFRRAGKIDITGTEGKVRIDRNTARLGRRGWEQCRTRAPTTRPVVAGSKGTADRLVEATLIKNCGGSDVQPA